MGTGWRERKLPITRWWQTVVKKETLLGSLQFYPQMGLQIVLAQNRKRRCDAMVPPPLSG